MEAVDVDDGKLRKKKAKSEKHGNVEDSNRDMEVVNLEDGNKRKKAKAEKHVNVENCNRNTEAVTIEDSEKRRSRTPMMRRSSHRLMARVMSMKACMKWYNQLASPFVNQKLWADIDDYLLLDALNSLEAYCIEDVDWDDLLEHRPGDVCQKRWEVTKHIGRHALNSFPEQLEVLSKRYPADIIEAIEVYDSKPIVD
ncbi:hypothetical protein M0R45_034511 [Rubus argutus]|uniref:Myb-like domain-containing protein n=1 Tax=Rubus argutus TaxID=59490 RepID=A0AAW1VQB8_RUBAR